ncbi:MAG: methylenetetrahydrofolate reductase [NAD(P)H] [Oceanococcaceae bacterium]
MSTPISFEFFPPRGDDAWPAFVATATELAALKPEYVSVTFGAGGSLQGGTLEAVSRLRASLNLDTAPHISCVGTTPESIRDLLRAYQEQGVRRLVVLRGDLPSGAGLGAGPFRYARDLVAFIRAETGAHFHIEVAAYPEMHPQARTPDADLGHFIDKVDAGADAAITQYFFSAAAYVDFVERVRDRGCTVAITPGIMPITNHRQLTRFSGICGAEIPRWIRLRLEQYGEDLASIRAFGEDVVTHLCEQLLAQGAPGLHFYTLNRTEPTRALCARLKLTA